VFGKLAGEHAAKFAKDNPASFGKAQEEQVEHAARDALAPLERQDQGGENPYAIQHELQDKMQELVGIVRRQDDLERGLDTVLSLKRRATSVTAPGNREYNPGWHTANDLNNLLTVAEAIARAAAERKESRGAHFRDDHPGKDETWGKTTLVINKGSDGDMKLTRETIKPLPDELQQIIEENQ
jgi:succinate dehydrogenase / fumarate reductase flavoprotein subunit